MTEQKLSTKHRYFAPEVIQSSAMDCGPASLKSLLAGYGIHVSYGRLREACQTDVDGTSIDTMEEIAVQLGLEAEQVMIPADHLLLPEAKALPALVVVRLPSGVTHFVVVWRRHGRLLQVMDPGIGRRWMLDTDFLSELYIHRMPVPASDWRDWAGTGESIEAIRRLLVNLQVSQRTIDKLVSDALSDPGWRPLAALDAATRMVGVIVRSGGLKPGRQAARLLRIFYQQAREEPADPEAEPIPETYWQVRSAPPDDQGNPQLQLTGAVLIRVRGRQGMPLAVPSSETGQEKPEPTPARLSPELVAALEEKPASPGRDLLRLLQADGFFQPTFLVFALLLSSLGVLLEATLFRGFLDIGRDLGLSTQRLVAVFALVALVGALLLVEWPIREGLLRMGRHLEARLRVAFLDKIPLLGDRYFKSRLASDMAERSHAVRFLRQVPVLGGHFLKSCFDLVLTATGIAILAPASTPIAVIAAVAVVVIPLALQPSLSERDLRLRSHLGALARFYLDALLGLVPIRCHGAERSVRREHEGLLVEWSRSGVSLQRVAVLAEALQALVGFSLAAWLLLNHLGQAGEAGTALLIIYWALNLPVYGQEVALAARQYPTLRNVTLRLMEPLGAPEESMGVIEQGALTALVPAASAESAGVSIRFDGVTVKAAGHTILQDIDLAVDPGSRVAIVGPSGAGKSSLVGVLLGWYRPASGRVLVDGGHLDSPRVAWLRRRTAWVDPSIQLWNRSFMDNLLYGTDPSSQTSLSEAIRAANLWRVLERLPEGLQTPLGESGALVSGGEGQRVRLGRAMMRPAVKLVILDEPFRGLDREQRRELLSRARQWWSGATLLCITHDVSETKTFDRVVVIENGRVAEDGRPDELASRPDSNYHRILLAEEQVRHELWSGAEWSRLWLDDGRLTVQGPGGPP